MNGEAFISSAITSNHETHGALQAFLFTVVKSASKQAGQVLKWDQRREIMVLLFRSIGLTKGLD
jgi:hypothetical protein